MNRKISILLIALVIMDILDGDFAALSILDGIKIILYILCFVLLIQNISEDKESTDR
jgi:hypothetical protein